VLVYILIGIVAGIVLAFILNTIFANKIGSKAPRIVMKVLAFVICIIFSIVISFLLSVKPTLNNFLDSRIAMIENTINRSFADKNLTELSLNSSNMNEIVDQMQQAVDSINTKSDGYFERKVYNSFISKLKPYLDTANSLRKEYGDVSIKIILSTIKNTALATISPYLSFIIILTTVIFLIIIAIHTGVVFLFRKGNKV
jgi:hypothetical protein